MNELIARGHFMVHLKTNIPYASCSMAASTNLCGKSYIAFQRNSFLNEVKGKLSTCIANLCCVSPFVNYKQRPNIHENTIQHHIALLDSRDPNWNALTHVVFINVSSPSKKRYRLSVMACVAIYIGPRPSWYRNALNNTIPGYRVLLRLTS